MCNIQRKILFAALAMNGLSNLLRHTINAPDVLLEFMMGLSAGFLLLGIIPASVYSKIRAWKRSVLKEI